MQSRPVYDVSEERVLVAFFPVVDFDLALELAALLDAFGGVLLVLCAHEAAEEEVLAEADLLALGGVLVAAEADAGSLFAWELVRGNAERLELAVVLDSQRLCSGYWNPVALLQHFDHREQLAFYVAEAGWCQLYFVVRATPVILAAVYVDKGPLFRRSVRQRNLKFLSVRLDKVLKVQICRSNEFLPFQVLGLRIGFVENLELEFLAIGVG